MTKIKAKKATKQDVAKMIDEVVKKDIEGLRVSSKVTAGHCRMCINCSQA